MTILGLGKVTLPATSGIEEEHKHFTDKLVLWFFALTMVAIILQLILIGLSWKFLPPQVPVFYSKPWGNDILAKPIFLWILPGFSVLVYILNFILSKLISVDNKFLNRIFAFTSLFVSLAILFDIFKIITLII